MTVYRKCQPCKHRDGCEIKARLAEAIKGFGVGTISHKCKSYSPDFKAGDNVWVRIQDVPHGNDWEGNLTADAEFPAHFVQYSNKLGRAIVFVEPGVTSRCGEYSFEPANGKNGFCKVSYAPYRQPSVFSFQKGITERRDGTTPIRSCCGRPVSADCSECSEVFQ